MADKPVGNVKLGFQIDGLSEVGNNLDEIQSKLRQTENYMKANMSAFDKAGKNVEYYGQKQKDLESILELQGKKIDVLNKRHQEATEKYGAESKQAVKLANEINKTTARYNAYANQLKDTKQAYIIAESGADQLTKAIKDNEKAMKDEVTALRKAGDETGALEAEQRGLKQQSELTEQAISAQRQAVEKMAKEFGESSTQTKQAEQKLEEFTRQAKITDAQLTGVTKAMDSMGNEAKKVDKELDGVSNSMKEVVQETGKTESGFNASESALSGLVAGLAMTISTKALDVATDALGTLVEAIGDARQQSELFTAGLGLADGDAEHLVKLANDLVRLGLADNLEEAQRAMSTILHASGTKEIDPMQLQEMTASAISLSKVFDADVDETVRGATRMMENFGISAEEAFDLLTAGSQRGLDSTHELGDNMAEYSQLWSQMGYGASETFSILQAGLDGGAYNLDKVNDLVKEMGISLTDGRFEENADMFSESTRNLFNEWKNGRGSQKDVVNGMLKDFSKMDTGYESLNKAGTVWSALGEDNSMKVIKAMAGVTDTYADVQGASDELNDTMGNTTAWDALKNGVTATFTEIGLQFTNFSSNLTPMIENFFKNTLPQWGEDMKWFATLIGNTIGLIIDDVKKMWNDDLKPSDYTMLNALGIDTETIWAIEDKVKALKEKIELVSGYVTGFWKLLAGDDATQMQGYSILRALGMSQEDIESFETIRDTLEKGFKSLGDIVSNLADLALHSLNEEFDTLYTFFTEDVAPTIIPMIESFSGSLERMGKLFEGTGTKVNGFKIAISLMWKYVGSVLRDMWSLFQIVFTGIQIAIEVVVTAISGIWATFVLMLQGKWNEAWDMIKQTFDRIINAIWQGIKDTFLGKIITTLGTFYKENEKIFTGIWDTITGIMLLLPNFMWNLFTELPYKIAEAFKGNKNVIIEAFKGVFNSVLKAIGKPVNGIIKGASWVLEKLGAEPLKEWEVPQYATGTPKGGHPGGVMMVNDGRGAEAVITPNGQAFIPKGRNVVMNAPKGTHVLTAEETAYMTGNKAPKYRYKKGTNFFGNLWDNVKGFAGDVGSKLKNTIGDVWEFMSDPASLAKKVLGGLGVLDGLTKYPLEVGKGILSKATSALTDKITGLFSSGNLDTSIGTNGVYKYLADVAKSVMAKFPGFVATSGYRPGDPYSHGKRNAIDIALPGVTGGSHKYTEAANYAFEKFASKIGYVITNGKVRDRSGQSGTGIHDDWRPWPDGDHYDHVHLNGIANPTETQISGENLGGSGVDRWRGVATQALRMTGQYSASNLNALLNQMRTESNGNPNAINNWDINAKNGTPSKGLLQVIDPTFRAYAMQGYNSNIYDPLSNILASIRYALSRYGSLTNAYRGVGYENGGVIKKQHLAMVGEGNKEEVVIPLENTLSKRSRALQLLAYAQEKLGTAKQATSLSSVKPSDSSVASDQMITLLVQQNQLLQAILEKNTDVYMDTTKVTETITRKQNARDRAQRRNLGLI